MWHMMCERKKCIYIDTAFYIVQQALVRYMTYILYIYRA